jgi:IS4 transposase
VVVLALPPEQAEAARRLARKNARKWGYTIGKKALATAGCVMLITSLPREAWAGSRILDLYRRRWQVELVFKRLKSVIGLEELRVHDAELVGVWIHAVLLIALLIDAERPSLGCDGPDSPPSAIGGDDVCPSGVIPRCSALD